MAWRISRTRLAVGWTLIALAVPCVAAPTRSAILFFDSGKPELSRDASEALATIVRKAPAATAWNLIGHGDRSGSTDANRRMALSRAVAVRDQLVALGADGARIKVSSAGEESPLVPTADGVREPQNRRVDVRAEE